MITIKEIARLAKASSSTVSRVLNNSGYVGEETRKRILKVIEETGYIPSEHAKSLRTKQTKVIGVILPRLSTDTSSRMVNAINDALAKLGYQMILANTNLNPEKEIENLKLLRSRQVDGIILLATNINEALIEEINKLKIPLVAVGQDIPGVSVVINNDYQAGKDMTSLLIEKGHEHIGFIGVPETDRAVGVERKQGYLDALTDHRLQTKPEWMVTANFDFDSGYLAMKEMVEQAVELPTAIFAVTDTIAIGAMHYLHEQKIEVPNKIAIAGTGNSKVSRFITPALSTIEFANEKVGYEAAQLIIRHIRGQQKERKKIVMKYRLIERDSV
ncbi:MULTISPECIES: LacI family DNA-binding transcriptional regulator [unclassified Virgibacillus]|uniref:LacI family DNA-binding transcriptional regulator n=1 Tax=unclassified Virgibacillus TaxID=2620237 RepID=UPI0024DE861A|nr:LacI family DNA-binding transcriptional regulator [Virgibacillus sp. LDC-1]